MCTDRAQALSLSLHQVGGVLIKVCSVRRGPNIRYEGSIRRRRTVLLCGLAWDFPSNFVFLLRHSLIQGWTTAGSSPSCATDVNECDASTGAPPCSTRPAVQCINTPGGFQVSTKHEVFAFTFSLKGLKSRALQELGKHEVFVFTLSLKGLKLRAFQELGKHEVFVFTRKAGGLHFHAHLKGLKF